MASMLDVARRAGLSTATVSRVLSGIGAGGRPETRARVLAAAEELGYQPNRLPRNLRAMSVRTIGLLVSDIGNPFFTAIARGCEDAAIAGGYSLLISSTDEDADREDKRLQDFAAERISGVILASAGQPGLTLRRMLAARTPVVAIDRRIDGINLDLVLIDNEAAAYRAVRHLLELGHHRIGVIGGPDRVSAVRDRLAGYRRALNDHRVPADGALIRLGDLRETGGYLGAKELLASAQPPSAIFSVNNQTTIGVLRAIHEQGLRIPDDISVIGFDDIATAELLTPPLTVVAQPTYEIGSTAAALVLRRAAEPGAPVQEVVLAAQLVVRGSTASPRRLTRPAEDDGATR